MLPVANQHQRSALVVATLCFGLLAAPDVLGQASSTLGDPGLEYNVEAPRTSPVACEPDVDSAAPSDTDIAGFLRVQAGVGPSGDAQVSVPLQLPPGRLAPSLALTYSSNAGYTGVGKGWALSGLSKIHRCRSLLAIDGEVRPVRLDSDDHYCLNGARLIEVDSAGDNVEFRLERDDLVRVVGRRAGTEFAHFVVYEPSGQYGVYGSTAQSQQWLGGVGTGHVYAWHVEEVFDRYQNSYRIVYEQLPSAATPEEVLPDYITYTHHPQASALRRIDFDYSQTLPEQTHAYVAGFAMRQTRQLSSVDVSVDAKLVKRYRLDQSAAPTGLGPLVLDRITVCEGDATGTGVGKCLKGTEFQYTDDTGGFGTPTVIASNNIPISQEFYFLTDIDGDGLDDFVFVAGLEKERDVDPATGDPAWDAGYGRFGVFVRYALIDPSNPANTTFSDPIRVATDQPPCNGNCESKKPIEIRPIDTNRDGVAEIALRFWRGIDDAKINLDDPSWYLYSYPGYPQGQDWAGSAWYSQSRSHDRFADADGDSTPDFFHCNTVDANDQDGTFDVLFGAGGMVATTVPCVTGYASVGILLIDLDGDGAVELVHTDSNGQTSAYRFANRPTQTEFDNAGPIALPNGPDTRRRPKIGDFNGDGLMDALYEDGGTVHLRWSTGGDSFVPQSWSEAVLANRLHFPTPNGLVDPTRIVDVNNDGRWDVLTFTSAGPVVQFARSAPTPGGQFFAPVSAGLSNYHEEFFLVGDMTGDGTPDPVQLNTSDETLRAFFQTSRPHLLSAVTEQPSDHLTYGFEYLALSQSMPGTGGHYDVYEANCNPMAMFPVHCVRGGNIYVVRKMLRDVGRMDDTQDYPPGEILYHYKNGRFGVTGRGFLGFEVIETDDRIAPLQKTTTFDYSVYDFTYDRYPFAGLVANEVSDVSVTDTQGGITVHVTETSRVHVSQQTVPGNGLVYRAVTVSDSREHRAAEVPSAAVSLGHTVVQSLDLDALGLPQRIVTTNPDGTSHEVTRRFDHFTSLSASANPEDNVWLIGLQTASENEWSGSTGARVNYELRGYYPEGTLQWTEVGSGALADNGQGTLVPAISDPLRLRTDLIYDAYGNLETTSVSDVGSATPQPRVSHSQHNDAERMFPTKLINPMGHTTYQGYHPVHGHVCWHQGTAGQVTTMTFDRLGRLRDTELPSTAHATVDFEWNDQNGIDNAYPYFTSTTEPGAPARRSLVDRLGREVVVQKESFQCGWVERVSAYDNRGRKVLQSIAYPDGQTPSNPADINGWNYDYDKLGRVKAERAPDEDPSTTDDDALLTRDYRIWEESGVAMGTMVTTVNGRGVSKVEFIDRMGRVARMRDELGNLSYYEYGPEGELTRVTDPAGNVRRVAFDDMRRRVAIDDPDSGVEVYGHTAFGEVDTVTDATGNTVDFDYDMLGRIVRRGDSVLGPLVYSEWIYDVGSTGVGLLHSATSADGHTRTLTYDAIQRTETETLDVNGDSYTHRYVYRPDGQLGTHAYPDAKDGTPFVVDFAYAANGQLAAIHDALDTGTPRRTFWKRLATDLDGRTTSEAYGEQGVVVDSSYANWGGLLGRTAKDPSGVSVLLRSYDYDQQRNLTGRTDHRQGWQEVLAYDDMDRLTLWGTQVGTTPVVTGAVYSSWYSLVSWTPSAMAQAESRLNVMDSGSPPTCGASYLPIPIAEAPTVNWKSVTADEAHATATLAVPIDDDGQPIGAMAHQTCAGGGYASCVEIQYDDLGNIQDKTGIGGYTYGAQVSQPNAPTFPGDSSAPATRTIPNAMTRAGLPAPVSYWYDAGGRLTSSPQFDITWTPWARPRRITSTKWDTSFGYDASGLRVWKERSTLVGGTPASPPSGYSTETVVSMGDYEHRRTTSFQGDGVTGIAASHDTSHYFVSVDGRAVAHVVHFETTPTVGDTAEVQITNQGQTPSQGVIDASNEFTTALAGVSLPSLENTRTLRYFVRGVSQSPALVLNEAGEIIEEHRYDPFGAQVSKSLDPANPERIKTHIGFRGYTNHDWDTEFGLVDMNGRMYSPTLARFLSPDPHVQAPLNSQSLNRYVYAWNNPSKHEDPSGFSLSGFVEEVGLVLYAFRLYELHQNDMLDEYLDAAIPTMFGMTVGGDIVFDLAELESGKSLTGNDGSHVAGGVAVALPVVSAGALRLFYNALPDSVTGYAVRLWDEIGGSVKGAPLRHTADTGAAGVLNDAGRAPAKSTEPFQWPEEYLDDAGRAAKGIDRESLVAELVGGEVSRKKIIADGVGATDVDVIGPAGEYISVGGPMKAAKVDRYGHKLHVLKLVADKEGRVAKAYLEAGTPESAIDMAKRHLGDDNVVIFTRKR